MHLKIKILWHNLSKTVEHISRTYVKITLILNKLYSFYFKPTHKTWSNTRKSYQIRKLKKHLFSTCCAMWSSQIRHILDTVVVRRYQKIVKCVCIWWLNRTPCATKLYILYLKFRLTCQVQSYGLPSSSYSSNLLVRANSTNLKLSQIWPAHDFRLLL